VVALITTLLIGLLGCAVIYLYGKRRPVDAPLTWGQAMAGAFFVFFMFVIWYAILPHQWLDYADNELNWTSDELIMEADGSPLEGSWPLDVNMIVVRDTVVILLHGLGLTLHVALWMIWQNRGKEKPVEEPTSQYGRPLVRKG
jgi:hypothetical protein